MNLISPPTFDAAMESAESVQADRRLAALEQAAGSGEAGKLWEVAEGFEEMFLRLMLGTMRKTTMKSDLSDNSNAMETYRSMQDEFLAGALAKSHQFGLSQMIVESITKRQPELLQASTDVAQAQKSYEAAASAGAGERQEIFADQR